MYSQLNYNGREVEELIDWCKDLAETGNLTDIYYASGILLTLSWMTEGTMRPDKITICEISEE